ncbi:hypothetical protein V6N11_004422 [Hibiscus sabdariffa]|uniref:Secreted protein n=1 Tax=Hibiscus sabdariffa TaxID=183260 RepID=A0ABR2SG99_9ROSI
MASTCILITFLRLVTNCTCPDDICSRGVFITDDIVDWKVCYVEATRLVAGAVSAVGRLQSSLHEADNEMYSTFVDAKVACMHHRDEVAANDK